MFQQDFHPEQNKYEATRYLRLGFVACAENSANFESSHRQNESRYADDGNGKGQVYVEAAERNAHGQGVDACGDGKQQHGLESQRGVGVRLAFRKGLAYHINAYGQKQPKGNPVVDGGHVVPEIEYEIVSYYGHQCLKAAEPQPHRKVGARRPLAQRQPLAHRHREGVHRKSYCQKQKR